MYVPAAAELTLVMFWTAMEVALEMKMKENVVHKNLISQQKCNSISNKAQTRTSQHTCRS